MPLSVTGQRIDGVPISLALLAVSEADAADASPWNVLAYEVVLKGRGGVKLARQDFEDCVRNVERFGHVPVVLYHADTDPKANPDAAMARGWITHARVGSMVRKGGRVATLEGRILFDEETKPLVNSTPPRLGFGSITIVQHATDEESGESIGSFLYSFSLTNRPALTDLPRLTAAQALPNAREQLAHEAPGMDLLALAARLGLGAATEADASAKINVFASEIATTLGLSQNFSAAEVRARAVALVNAEGRATELATKCATADALAAALAKQVDAFARKEAAGDVAALVARGAIADSKRARTAAIDLRVKHPDEFTAMFGEIESGPRTTAGRAETNDLATLTAELVPEGGEPREPVVQPLSLESRDDQIADRATALQAAKPGLSYRDALLQASRELSRRR